MESKDHEIAALFMNESSVKENLKKAEADVCDDQTYSIEEALSYLKQHFQKEACSKKSKN